MSHPPAGHTRILAWMCVLIAVNQLGFGSVDAGARALRALVRRRPVGHRPGHRHLRSGPLPRSPCRPVSSPIAPGARGALALGGLVTAAGNLLCAWAPTYATFITARFVAGAGAGLVMITGQIVLADITTPANRGRAMAIYQGVFLFAVGIGPLPGGVLAERSGLAAPFVVYAGAGVAGRGAGLAPHPRDERPPAHRSGARPRPRCRRSPRRSACSPAAWASCW